MIKLEKMDDFFAARVNGYDDHMRTNIEGYAITQGSNGYIETAQMR